MTRLRPIPKRLLPDTMLVRVPDGDGGYAEGVAVARVRFVRSQAAGDDAHRSADAGQGRVFVDAHNSIGAFEVPAGSRVVIGGHSYLVERCWVRCGWDGRVHHWELDVR